MSDYAFFEYQAKLINTGHPENEGKLVHCMIRMKDVDRYGKRLHEVELHQQAEDNVLFVINPGPHRAINHSSIWNVTEEELHKLENVSDYHRVGDCEIYFHNADDRSSSPVSGGRELIFRTLSLAHWPLIRPGAGRDLDLTRNHRRCRCDRLPEV